VGYFKDVAKGVGWMTALRGVTRGLAVVKIAVLARVLSPSQFGNYGVALLILGFLEVLTETGINIFLIQEKDETEKYLDSAWVVSIIRGILISLIIIAVVPWVVYFFKMPCVKNLLYLVAGTAFVRGFINPMEVIFQKNLKFKSEFAFRGGLYFIDALVAISLGLLTHNESAMLIGMLASSGVEVFLSFALFKSRPKLKIQKDKVAKVIASGKWVTGAGIFSYIFQNIDNFVVGKFLGATNLGYYQQAYSISTLPVSEVGQIFNKVTFPVYVNISGDVARLKKAFLKTLGTISALVIPFALVILFLARPIILVFLGPGWLTIEPVLKILAIFGIFKSILNFSYSLFLSLKLQKYVMYSELMGIIGMGIFIFPLTMKFGIFGAGATTIIAFIFSLPVVIYGLVKVFKTSESS
jgi:O-antigen/teichoic acid export membrane protein